MEAEQSTSSNECTLATSEPKEATIEPMIQAEVVPNMPLSKFGNKSYILNNDMATDIHKENIQTLQNMDEQEILSQRQELLKSLGKSYHNCN